MNLGRVAAKLELCWLHFFLLLAVALTGCSSLDKVDGPSDGRGQGERARIPQLQGSARFRLLSTGDTGELPVVAVRRASVGAEGFDLSQLFAGKNIQYRLNGSRLPHSASVQPRGDSILIEALDGTRVYPLRLQFQDEFQLAAVPPSDQVLVKGSPLLLAGQEEDPIDVWFYRQIEQNGQPVDSSPLSMQDLLVAPVDGVQFSQGETPINEISYWTLLVKGVRVRAVDRSPGRWPKTVYLSILPREKVKYAPRFLSSSSVTVRQDMAEGQEGYDAQATVEDNGLADLGISYSLASDEGAFRIEPGTGRVRLVRPFYGKTRYRLEIVARSGSLMGRLELTVINAASTLSFSSSGSVTVAENTVAGTEVYDADASLGGGAADAGIRYALGGTGADDFILDPITGKLRFQTSPDYQRKSSYTLTITARARAFQQALSLTVNIKPSTPFTLLKKWGGSTDVADNLFTSDTLTADLSGLVLRSDLVTLSWFRLDSPDQHPIHRTEVEVSQLADYFPLPLQADDAGFYLKAVIEDQKSNRSYVGTTMGVVQPAPLSAGLVQFRTHPIFPRATVRLSTPLRSVRYQWRFRQETVLLPLLTPKELL